MTERTPDLITRPTEPDEPRSVEGTERPADDTCYPDLVAGALIEDAQLDLVDWFE